MRFLVLWVVLRLVSLVVSDSWRPCYLTGEYSGVCVYGVIACACLGSLKVHHYIALRQYVMSDLCIR